MIRRFSSNVCLQRFFI